MRSLHRAETRMAIAAHGYSTYVDLDSKTTISTLRHFCLRPKADIRLHASERLLQA
jgi:hypothetical protein